MTELHPTFSESDIPTKPGVRISYDLESMWSCNHCGKEFVEKKAWRARISGEFDDPSIFERVLDFCPPCAKLMGQKLVQIVTLYESEGKA